MVFDGLLWQHPDKMKHGGKLQLTEHVILFLVPGFQCSKAIRWSSDALSGAFEKDWQNMKFLRTIEQATSGK